MVNHFTARAAADAAIGPQMGEQEMTGCDLRYMAEEMVRNSRETAGEFRNTILVLADDVAFAVESKPVAALAEAVAALVARIKEVVSENREATQRLSSEGFATIEKIREHFHEAVDERVRSESDSLYTEEQAIDMANDRASDAVSSLKRHLKQAIVEAIDDCDPD